MSVKIFSLRRWLRWGIIVFISLLTVGVMFRRLPREPLRTAQPSLPNFGRIPDFSLTSSDNKTVGLSDLQGKVWVADFVFTHCAGPCPLMSGVMSQLVKQLPEESSIRFVSFSVDPGRDTPEVLSEYAKRYQADPEKWFFLTGDKAQIYQLSEQHFHLGVGEVPPQDRETPDQSVMHSTKFVLVDQKGSIRGYYDSTSEWELKKLIQDAGQLLKEGR